MQKAVHAAIAYLILAIVFLACDFVWISLNNSWLYQPVLQPHLASQYDWLAVGLFYPIYFAGVVVFVVRPLENRCSAPTFLPGILFGFVSYATYDLTNQATLSGWTWRLTCVDMAWGACATAVSATLARLVINWLRSARLSQANT